MSGSLASLQMAAAARGKRLPYKRVLIEWQSGSGSAVQIVLAGLRLNDGTRRPRHVVAQFLRNQRDQILRAARQAAEIHSLDLIDDTIGIVDRELGPVVYSLTAGQAPPRPGAA